MPDLFDGDPLITIDENGADFNFVGGQPEMDQGFANHVNISLLTEPGWWGNDLEPIAARKIGSLYLDESIKPINRQMLLDTSKAAVTDVSGDEFGNVEATTTNPLSQNVDTEILYTPPTRELQKLLLTRTGQNWVSQAGSEKLPEFKPGNPVIRRGFRNLTTKSGDIITTVSGDQIMAKIKELQYKELITTSGDILTTVSGDKIISIGL